jgi:WD40 repeat protein
MFDRSGDHLVAANLEGYALVWDLRRAAQLTTIKAATDDYLESVAISADGQFIATGSGEGDVKAFD